MVESLVDCSDQSLVEKKVVAMVLKLVASTVEMTALKTVASSGM